MKKILIKSCIGSLIINAVCLIINLVCALSMHKLPLGLYIPGGDMVSYVGFGIALDAIFASNPLTKAVGTNYHVRFSVLSLLSTFVSIFVILFIILFIVSKIKKKKS